MLRPPREDADWEAVKEMLEMRYPEHSATLDPDVYSKASAGAVGEVPEGQKAPETSAAAALAGQGRAPPTSAAEPATDEDAAQLEGSKWVKGVKTWLEADLVSDWRQGRLTSVRRDGGLPEPTPGGSLGASPYKHWCILRHCDSVKCYVNLCDT